jgi:hypothetical protein
MAVQAGDFAQGVDRRRRYFWPNAIAGKDSYVQVHDKW